MARAAAALLRADQLNGRSSRSTRTVAAAVVAAGLADLGESYARELADKAVAVAATDVATPRWHFIGQLQTNKVRVVAPHVHLFHSIDRSSLIAAVARRVPGAAVLIQVDLAEAPGRGGCAFGELDGLVDAGFDAGLDAGLDVRGLMGVAPLAPEVDVARSFGALRRAVDRLGLTECSMGMSQDLEVAVAEGSTMVRIGTALVGARA